MKLIEYVTGQVVQFFGELKRNKNKAATVIKHKNFLTGCMVSITVVYGFFVMLGLGQSPTIAIMNTLKLFSLSIPENSDSKI